MPGLIQGGVHEDVACPFCGLLCDDLKVESRDGRLTVRENGCARAVAAFARETPAARPGLGGRPAGLEEATAEAARLLGNSRLPLFAGLGADVEGLRALMALAERCGGVIDHMNGEGLFRNLAVMTERGWMVTTFSEVRNRADLALFVGPDPRDAYPRLFERCLGPVETLFAKGPLERRVIRLGPPPPAGGAGGAGRVGGADDIETIPCPLDRLPEAVALLRALLADPERSVPGATEGLPLDALRALARDLPGARYGVIAWMAAAFDDAWGALAIEGLGELVRSLNRKTRYSGLPLTGDDNLIGAHQVATWQSGLPLRSGFARGGVEHDPRRFATRRLLVGDGAPGGAEAGRTEPGDADAGEADLLVWVSAFRPLPPPARRAGLPTIVLTTPGETRPEAEVTVPVATPGLDHFGRVFRGDSVVALPLAALRESTLPSVAQACEAILAALDAGESQAGGPQASRPRAGGSPA